MTLDQEDFESVGEFLIKEMKEYANDSFTAEQASKFLYCLELWCKNGSWNDDYNKWVDKVTK